MGACHFKVVRSADYIALVDGARLRTFFGKQRRDFCDRFRLAFPLVFLGVVTREI